MRRFRKLTRRSGLLLVLAAALGAAVAATGTARADSSRITRGDVEALFQAGFNGGAAIRVNGDVLEGAPVTPGAAIRPFSGGTVRHFCALDWHVIAATFLDVFPQSADVHAQAVADLSSTGVEIRLDGVPLTLEQTAIKAANPTSIEESFGAGMAGFGFQAGHFVAPGALAPGTHTLQLTAPFTGPLIQFVIDPAGSATCG